MIKNLYYFIRYLVTSKYPRVERLQLKHPMEIYNMEIGMTITEINRKTGQFKIE